MRLLSFPSVACIETLLLLWRSDDESSGEQGDVPGLSDFMAEALRVVSAPDAFIQNDQGHRSIALPCFSFNKRGALVKTMSRKHSTASSGTIVSMSAMYMSDGGQAAVLVCCRCTESSTAVHVLIR